MRFLFRLQLSSVMRSRYTMFVLLLSLFLPPFAVRAQIQFRVDNIYRENGQKLGQIHAIYRDRKGYLWIGGEPGLYRYDSKSVVPANELLTKSAYFNSFVFDITEDREGNIWVANQVGIYRIDATMQKVERMFPRPEDSLPLQEKPWVHKLYFDQKGVLWFANHYGLNAWLPGKGPVVNFPVYDGLNIPAFKRYMNFIHADGEHELLLGTGDGVSRFNTRTGKWFRLKFNTEADIEDLSENLICAHYKVNDTLHLFGTWASGMKEYNPATGQIRTVLYSANGEQPGSKNIIMSIVDAYGAPGEVLVATGDNGMGKYNYITHTFLFPDKINNSIHSVDNAFVRVLYADHEKNIWVGTNTGLQLHVPLRNSVRYFRLQENVPPAVSNEIIAAAEDKNTGLVYLATYNNGVWAWNQKTNEVTPVHTLSSAETGLVETMFYSRNLIFLCSHKGILIYAPEIDFSYLCYKHIPSVIIDHDVQNDSLVFLYTTMGNAWELNTKSGGLNPIVTGIPDQDTLLAQTRKILLLDKDRMLVGTYRHGLLMLDRHRKKILWQIDKYGDLPLHDIMDINRDVNGDIWIATLRAGVYRLNINRNTIYHYSAFGGSTINTAYTITSDRENTLWIGTNSCLVSYNPITQKSKLLTEEDGLETNKLQCGIILLQSGKMLVQHYFGFSLVDPMQEKLQTQTPVLRLNYLKVNNELVSTFGLEGLTLSHDENDFEVDFTSFSYIHPQFNRYFYKLEGLDNKWRDNGNSNKILLSEVPHGSYRLLLKAYNSDGNTNFRNLSIPIVINPPYYKTVWFFFSVVLVLAMIINAVITVRIRQLEKVQQIRNKIASDLHDEVGSALSSIRLYSGFMQTETSVQPQIREVLSKIENTSRESLENMSDIVWSINAKNDKLEKVIARMRQFSDAILPQLGMKPLYDLHAENINISMESRRQLYLFYKEAITNIAKYSEATEVRIVLQRKGSEWELEICDNGIGFEREGVSHGNGLQNMEERALLMGGSAEVKSTPGEGTCVKLRFRTT